LEVFIMLEAQPRLRRNEPGAGDEMFVTQGLGMANQLVGFRAQQARSMSLHLDPER
jgi:hypothetical protein